MRPVQTVSELAQEAAGRYSAATRTANVSHIRKVALELRGVLLAEWQRPAAIFRGLTSGEDLFAQFLAVAHDAGAMRAKRNDAGAGQRGDINYGCGLEAARVGQGVAKYQATFCIRIQN